MAMTTRSRDKNVGQAGCMNKEASIKEAGHHCNSDLSFAL